MNDIPNIHKIAIAQLCWTLLNSAILDQALAFQAHSFPLIPNAIQQQNAIIGPTYGIKFKTISIKGQ